MPRGKIYKIDYGNYAKCNLCDYEIRNNKIAMRLHFKYSHPKEEINNGKKDRNRCNICKKEDCKIH